MGHYVTVHVETFREGSELHVRPIAGQKFSTSLNVQCSKKMRETYPVGTVFELDVQLIDRVDGSKHLMAPHDAPYKIVRRGPSGAQPVPDLRPGSSASDRAVRPPSMSDADFDETSGGRWKCAGCRQEFGSDERIVHARNCAALWLAKNPKGRL